MAMVGVAAWLDGWAWFDGYLVGGWLVGWQFGFEDGSC